MAGERPEYTQGGGCLEIVNKWSVSGAFVVGSDQKRVITVDYDSIAGSLASFDLTQMGRAFNAFLRVRFYL